MMSLSENASLQMQIRQCMQKEIEEMHDKLKGEAFLPI